MEFVNIIAKPSIKTQDVMRMCFIFIEYQETLKENNTLSFFKDSFDLKTLQFEAFLIRHRGSCTEPECVCQNPNENECHSSFCLSISIFRDIVSRKLGDEKMNLNIYFIFCIFLMKCSKNHLQATSYITKYSMFAESFSERFMTFVLTRMIAEKVEENNYKKQFIELFPSLNPVIEVNPNFNARHKENNIAKGSLDFERILTFEDKITSMHRVIHEYSTEQIRFWQMIKSKEDLKDILKIEKTLRSLESKDKLIKEEVWGIEQVFGVHRQSALLYGAALFFLRNEIKGASFYFKKAIRSRLIEIEKFMRAAFLSNDSEIKLFSVLNAIYQRVTNSSPFCSSFFGRMGPASSSTLPKIAKSSFKCRIRAGSRTNPSR